MEERRKLRCREQLVCHTVYEHLNPIVRCEVAPPTSPRTGSTEDAALAGHPQGPA